MFILNLNNKFKNLVEERYSCRSFDGEGIEKSKIRIIQNNFINIQDNIEDFRFSIIDIKELRNKNFFSMGTYGMFKGNRYHVAGILKKNQKINWEKFGFYMENIVMLVTDIGLNSCWIGGVFDRKGFGHLVNIKESEILPAVIAVGYKSNKRSMRDKIVRWFAKGDNRKSPDELFHINNFNNPVNYSRLEKTTKIALKNVRKAPSASNKQPWRIIIRDDYYHFFLKRDKFYSSLIPKVDLQRIDMGIAIFHFYYSMMEKSCKLKKEKIKLDIEIPNQYTYIISFKRI